MQRGFISRTPALPGAIGRTQLFFYEPDTGANPAGSGAGQGGQGGGQSSDQGDRQNLQGLLQRHNNDAMAVIATLLSENHSLRDERRQLRGQLPAQGAVVLSAEDASRWQAYQQLGAVDSLTQQLQGAQAAQTELSGLKREKHISDVAAIGDGKPWKASVLGQLPGADKLTFEIREATQDGKAVKTVVVKDGTAETPLTQYAQTHWADFLPALQAGQVQQQPAGTSFVRQDAGGQPPATPLDAYAKRFQEQRDAAPNPLAPAAPRPPIA